MSKKLAVVFAIVTLISFAGMIHAQVSMNNFCMQPPFVARVLKPNVVILMDNSGSMHEKAMLGSVDGGTADWDPGTVWYGYFNSDKWYQFVTANTRFEEVGDKASLAKQLDYYDGNFLNWMTMRRMDVVKKVIMGGKTSGRTGAGNPHTLLGEPSGGNSSSYSITSAGNYVDQNETQTSTATVSNASNNTQTGAFGCSYSLVGSTATAATVSWTLGGSTNLTSCVSIRLRAPDNVTEVTLKSFGQSNAGLSPANVLSFYQTHGPGTYRMVLQEQSSCHSSGSSNNATLSGISMTVTGNFATTATRSFQLRDATTSSDLRRNGTTGCSSSFDRAVRVLVDTEPTGIYQATDPDIRFGLAFYNSEQGGKIMEKVQETNPTSFITTIEAESPGGFTPLGESIHTIIGFYAQDNTQTGDGPRYFSSTSSSYTVNKCHDPYNFNNHVGGTASACDAAKVMVPCVKSFIIAVTDGLPTRDINLPTAIDNVSSTYAGTCTVPSGTGACGFSGSFPTQVSDCCLENVTLYGHWNPGVGERDLRSDLTGAQSVGSYLVFAAFGAGGSTILDIGARNGLFDDSNGNNVPDLQSEFDADGDGVSDGFFNANTGQELETALTSALQDILKRAGSATANSVIGAGKGQGATIMQAFFFPRKQVGTADLTWVGFLTNLWFQVDPLLGFANIREDSCTGANCEGDDVLHVINDKIATFLFDPTIGEATVRRFTDSNGNGLLDGADATPLSPDLALLELKAIWEAGIDLFNRAPSSRDIRTTVNGTAFLAFTTANVASLYNGGSVNFLQATSNANALDIIDYVRGTDIAGSRPRTTTINIAGTNVTNTWKLGDIIDSTAQLQGPIPLNDYHLNIVYNDSTYRRFVTTTAYLDRASAYFGSNDGIFHSLYMGELNIVSDSARPNEVAEILDPSSLGKGKEQWAYIPRNALPYLRYLMDNNYCHLFYVNGVPLLFDASISDSSISAAAYPDVTKLDDNGTPGDLTDDILAWRTIVIGSMGQGGGCGCTTANCVQSPYNGNTPPEGLSSYFALDVTDPFNPVLLWEFSNPNLGFTTAKPAIVKISATTAGSPDTTKSGHWFVVLGSGPTGDVQTLTRQFRGRSDQNLRYFILNLKDGSLLRTIDTGIASAFSGNLSGVVDSDKDYQDEVVYGGFIKLTSGVWNQGGVMRIVTHEDSNPANWTTSLFMNDVGPVPSQVSTLVSIGVSNIQYEYFGTGRYYFKDDSGNIDDSDTQRRIFGVKEPCYSTTTKKIDPTCTTTVLLTDLFDASVDAFAGDVTSPTYEGFYINLDIPANASAPDKAERIITDPEVSSLGVVFFTSFAPSSDPCTFGGKTFIWALRFDTGGSGAGFLYGFALIQTSTGQIEQQELATAFTAAEGASRGASNEASQGFERRTASFLGQPPREGALTVLTPPPFKTILRIKEQ